jgi:hypothetical protein
MNSSNSAAEATAIDRRAFLATFGAAAGALVVASMVPLAAARGADDNEHVRPSAAGSVATEDDWDVDDICGHSPRYAHPIPHAPARSSPVMWECVDPIDRMLV